MVFFDKRGFIYRPMKINRRKGAERSCRKPFLYFVMDFELSQCYNFEHKKIMLATHDQCKTPTLLLFDMNFFIAIILLQQINHVKRNIFLLR